MADSFLIGDLCFIFGGATLGAFFAYLAHLPLLVGYLLSGLLLHSFHCIKDSLLLQQVSELGVLFLMFYIGLEFDLSRLKQTFLPALGALLLQCIGMALLGFYAARWLGLGWVDGCFLAGVLCISSTMVTIPILRAQDALKRSFGQLAISILVLEDMIAVVFLVILTGLSVTGHFHWNSVGHTIFFTGVFVVMVFFIGRLLSPYFIRLLEVVDSAELLTIATVGFMLGIGQLSKHYSLPLGAFLAGTLLSKSSLAEQIESVAQPLRDIFSALFFVSMGMMIDCKALVNYAGAIILLTLLLVIGKAITCWIGLFLAGQKPETALRASLCKAHIGEFGFIIASLGIQARLVDERLMALTAGVALGGILLAAPLSKHSDVCGHFLVKFIPRYLKNFAHFYQHFLMILREQLDTSKAWKLMKKPLGYAIIHFFLLNGTIGLASFLSQYATVFFENKPLIFVRGGIWMLITFAGLPFFGGIVRNLDSVLVQLLEASLEEKQASTSQYVKRRIANIFHKILLSVCTVALGSTFLSAAAHYLPSGFVFAFFTLFSLTLVIFFRKEANNFNGHLENLFMENFHGPIHKHEEARKLAIASLNSRYLWDIRLHKINIPRNSSAIGKRIADIPLRKLSGATVIGIGRGRHVYYEPSPETPLFPGDDLYLLGEEKQLQAAQGLLFLRNPQQAAGEPAHELRAWTLEAVLLDSHFPLVNETLAGAKIRNHFGVNIVGIQRGHERITSPKPDDVLKVNDILFVVGLPEQIEHLRKGV